VAADLADACAIPQAVAYWDVLERLYHLEEDENVRDRLANTLSEVATPDQFDRLTSLVGDQSLGESRIFLLAAVKRLGGKRGLDVLQSLLDDPELGKEARALLGRQAARGAGS
jgi:hypothetical protein